MQKKFLLGIACVGVFTVLAQTRQECLDANQKAYNTTINSTCSTIMDPIMKGQCQLGASSKLASDNAKCPPD